MPNQSPLAGGDSISFHTYTSLEAIDDEFLDSWRRLSSNSLFDNAFTSPDFVIPSIRWLTPEIQFIIIGAAKVGDDGSTLIALGVFEDVASTFSIPYRHLHVYKSIHSFLSGILISCDHAEEGLAALFGYLKSQGHWHSVRIDHCPNPIDGANEHLETLDGLNVKWCELNRYQRAVLDQSLNPSNSVFNGVSKRTRKSISRNRRKLDECGEVTWSLIRGSDIDEINIDRFIEIEDSGWKKEKGTSIAANPEQAGFLREMMNGFCANNQVFICELGINGKIACSTINLLCGQTMFAFKIGRLSEYDSFGVGIITEYCLMEKVGELLPEIGYMDSGSQPGSYIESLWKEKRTLVSGTYALSRRSKLHTQFLLIKSQARRRLKNWLKPAGRD